MAKQLRARAGKPPTVCGLPAGGAGLGVSISKYDSQALPRVIDRTNTSPRPHRCPPALAPAQCSRPQLTSMHTSAAQSDMTGPTQASTAFVLPRAFPRQAHSYGTVLVNYYLGLWQPLVHSCLAWSLVPSNLQTLSMPSARTHQAAMHATCPPARWIHSLLGGLLINLRARSQPSAPPQSRRSHCMRLHTWHADGFSPRRTLENPARCMPHSVHCHYRCPTNPPMQVFYLGRLHLGLHPRTRQLHPRTQTTWHACAHVPARTGLGTPTVRAAAITPLTHQAHARASAVPCPAAIPIPASVFESQSALVDVAVKGDLARHAAVHKRLLPRSQ